VNPLLAALVRMGLLSLADAQRIDGAMNPEQAQLYAEQLLQAAFGQAFSEQQVRLIRAIQRGGIETPEILSDAWWAQEDVFLERAILPTLEGIAGDYGAAVMIRARNFDTWRAVNQGAIDWVNGYYRSQGLGSLPNLNATSREIVADMMNAWRQGTLQLDSSAQGLPRLVKALEPAFGRQRAQTIAETEVTRTQAESTKIAGDADEFVTGYSIITAADERVCPICGPLDGVIAEKGSAGFVHPSMGFVGWNPFHPKCRCRLQFVTRRVRGASLR
jgi:SPP1 gp7 family putative phage head morphogenesis protein